MLSVYLKTSDPARWLRHTSQTVRVLLFAVSCLTHCDCISLTAWLTAGPENGTPAAEGSEVWRCRADDQHFLWSLPQRSQCRRKDHLACHGLCLLVLLLYLVCHICVVIVAEKTWCKCGESIKKLEVAYIEVAYTSNVRGNIARPESHTPQKSVLVNAHFLKL